jgi:hypothetical protein
MLWSRSTAWRCMHAPTAPVRAGELFVRTLVQRSAMRLAADVAPSAARARRAARNGLATDGSPGQTHTLGRVGGQVPHSGRYGQAGPGVNGAAGLLRNGYEPAAGNGQAGDLVGFGVPGLANGYTGSGNGYAPHMGNGHTARGEGARSGTGPVRSPEQGYAPPPGSDGLAPEPVSTALLAQPRAPPLVDSMKKDQREARSPLGGPSSSSW